MLTVPKRFLVDSDEVRRCARRLVGMWDRPEVATQTPERQDCGLNVVGSLDLHLARSRLRSHVIEQAAAGP